MRNRERKALSAAQNVELEAIARKHRGELRPQHVVAFAKHPKTALHAHFTWDDTKAAHLFRLIQAGQLISVKVRLLEGPKGEPVKFRAYIPFTRKGNIVYRAVEDVLSNEELRAEAERNMTRQVQNILHEQRTWAKVSPLYQRLEKAIRPLDAVVEEMAQRG